jgi:hypothetical protein
MPAIAGSRDMARSADCTPSRSESEAPVSAATRAAVDICLTRSWAASRLLSQKLPTSALHRLEVAVPERETVTQHTRVEGANRRESID